jgi:hypothetical protein
MQNMQSLKEAKLSATQCLKFLEQDGGDCKSEQPALNEIKLNLGKIDGRVKRIGASEILLVNKV